LFWQHLIVDLHEKYHYNFELSMVVTSSLLFVISFIS